MILLTAAVTKSNQINLVIVLGDDNLERIKQYDPVEVIWHELPWRVSSRFPHTIAVAYATREELELIERLAKDGKQEEALQLVTRGWRFRPELGDHDFGPVALGKPSKETKQ